MVRNRTMYILRLLIPQTCLKIVIDHILVFKQIFVGKLFGGCTIHTLVTLLL